MGRDHRNGLRTSQPLVDIKAPLDGQITVIRTSPSVAAGNVLIEMHKVLENQPA